MPNSINFMSISVDLMKDKLPQSATGDPLSTLLRELRFGARVFFRSQYCGQWGVNTSGHQQIAFHLIAEGESWLHGFSENPQRLIAGQLVMFPHDSKHLLSNSEKRSEENRINIEPPEKIEGRATRLICGLFTFDQVAVKPLLANLPDAVVLDLSKDSNPSVRTLVNHWMFEAANDQVGSDVAVDRLAELVFIEILRSEIRKGSLDGAFGALGDTQLSKVLTLIHQQPGASHSVTAMAELAGMSESAFAQKFKRLVGMSCGKYIKHWRMQTAARALAESRRSITDIADATGYESEAAFRKAFRAHFDISPGRYRRENRAEI